MEWNGGKKALQFGFKPLKMYSIPYPKFSLSDQVESPCLFLP